MPQVGIDPSYFAKSLKDYKDWHWAFVREIYQNSIGCGSKNIHFTIKRTEHEGQSACLVNVRNDGPPMSEEVLTNKLLCIGGTTKDLDSEVGGFGIAKLVLYLAHHKFKIHTGDLIVTGCGGEYEITKGDFLDGTESEVVMDCTCSDINYQLKKFVKHLYWQGTTYINDHYDDDTYSLCPRFLKGNLRREVDYGKLYTNKSDSNLMLVRVDGIPMFTEYASIDRCVVLELTNSNYLTSNRDGLIYPYNYNLNSLILDLAVNKKAALDAPPRYMRWEGQKRGFFKPQPSKPNIPSEPKESQKKAVPVASGAIPIPATGDTENTLDVDVGVDTVDVADIADTAVKQIGIPADLVGPGCQINLDDVLCKSSLGIDFIIKNDTGLSIPKDYMPSSSFSSYSQKLVSCWNKIIYKIHDLMDFESVWSIGFYFSDEPGGFEINRSYGAIYYINPIEIVQQNSSQSRSFKKRWSFTDGKYGIIATAAHQFVHCWKSYNYHDENFLNYYSEVMTVVMKNFKSFHKCFR